MDSIILQTPDPRSANPYAAPASIVSPRLDGQPQELAPRGVRLIAFIVDIMLATVVSAIAYRIFFTALFPSATGLGAIAAATLLCIGCVWAVNFTLMKNGQTIGKHAFELYVVTEDYQDVPGPVMAKRCLFGVLWFVPVFGFLLILLEAACILGPSRKSLRDEIFRTLVVRR